MAQRYGRSRPRQSSSGAVQVRWESHLNLDVHRVAENIQRNVDAKIRANVDAGKGAEGSFRSLKDSTIERYERDRLAVAYDGGTRSKLQRTGRMLAGLTSKKMSSTEDKARMVVIFFVENNPIYAYIQNAIRKWLRLNRSDFSKVMASSTTKDPKTITVKRGPPPGFKR